MKKDNGRLGTNGVVGVISGSNGGKEDDDDDGGGGGGSVTGFS